MNLVVDVGNTLCKWAIVHEGELVKKGIVVLFNQCFVESLQEQGYAIKRIVLSTVRNFSESLLSYLQNNFSYTQLNYELDMPLKINYASPQTLGVDRVAAALGAVSTHPSQACLIVDAGSAITIDVVTEDAEFIGGNISPGIHMRFRALNQYTDKLPLVEFKQEYIPFGNDTESAIRAGVQQAVVYEIGGYVSAMRKKYANLQVVLTGGDAAFINEAFDKRFEVQPDLVIMGLMSLI